MTKEITMMALLEKFVAPSTDPREFTRAPFTVGPWVYATNGVIAVRVPRFDGPPYIGKSIACRVEALFEGNKRLGFVDIPDLPAAVKCLSCAGTGFGYDCPDCEGDGDIIFGNHLYTCKECGGLGQVDDGNDADRGPCKSCNGDGDDARQRPIQVGNGKFARYYLALIDGLPASRFAPSETEFGVAWFDFIDGEGVLMPMRP